jgi:hypothetical protein
MEILISLNKQVSDRLATDMMMAARQAAVYSRLSDDISYYYAHY